MATKQSINQAKYDKENIEKYYLKFHKINDKDIIAAIDSKNKQGSIKELLRQAIKLKEGE